MTRPPESIAPEVAEIERVERAAAALSPLEREILTLSAGHGPPNADVGARLGLSVRRVERLLARALRKFDRAMERPPRRWWRFRCR